MFSIDTIFRRRKWYWSSFQSFGSFTRVDHLPGTHLDVLSSSCSARLVLADISEKGLQKTASSIKEAGHTHKDAATIAPIVNVTKWEQQRDVFEFAEKKLGKIDVVVSCAGVTERQPGFLIDKYDSA